MIKVNSNILKEASDVLNRVKGDSVYLKTINKQLYFVSELNGLSVYFDLSVQVSEDINIKVDIGNTVQFNRVVDYFKDDGVDVVFEINETDLSIYNEKRVLDKLIEQSNTKRPDFNNELISTNKIDGIELKEIVDGVGSLRSKDNARPELTGLRLDKGGFVALDGYVLGLYHKKLDINESFVLDEVTVEVLKRLLIKFKDDYTIEEYEDGIKIITDNITIYVNSKLKAKFDYKKILNDNHDFVIKTKTDELRDDIGFLINSGDYSQSIFEQDGLVNKVNEYGKEAQVKTDYSLLNGEIDEDFTIHYSNQLLSRVLKIYDSEEINIGYNFSGRFDFSVSPMIIRNEKITSLVLPIRPSK